MQSSAAGTVSLHGWSDRASGTDVLPGAFVQGAVELELTDRMTLTGFGRYDWSQSLDGNVGPSSFSVDPTGWSLGAMVGVRF